MRVVLYIFMIVSSGTLFGQQVNENLNNTTNSPATNTNVSPTITLEESVVIDSTANEMVPQTTEDLESIQVKKAPGAKRFRFNGKSKMQDAAPASPAKDIEVKEKETLYDEGYGASSVESSKSLKMQSVSVEFSNSYSSSDLQRTSRSPSDLQQLQMDQAVNYFEVNAPGSFESHYFKYVAGNYNTDLYPDLKAAEQLRPQNSDVHVQMAGYFMIENDVDSALIYMNKLKESNRLTSDVVAYAGDILRSAPENGTLITHGFDDSYGSYYAQNSDGVRSDVTLVSLDFLQSDTYQEELEAKGFELPKSDVVDVDYLTEFCVLNVDKNLSISMTTPKEYFQAIQDKLYVAGLVFEYHEDDFNNFQRNDFLWNNSMKKTVITHPTDEKAKQLSANYLPMLLHLRRAYRATGDNEKLNEVDEVSDHIGVQCRKYEQVQKVKSSY
ncbi:MAG: hypothetical protein HWE22_07000 [Flavobacteriales bacterium]|nr:hypothetical protein [Flavobacteriales bacterium]